VPEDGPPCENDRDGGFGTDEETVGLNVTVRCGFAGICCRLECNDDIRGVVSVELDAIVTDAAISVSCDCNLTSSTRARATTCHNGDCRDSVGPSVGERKGVLMGAGTVNSL
jgi:hypothetical protein